MRHRQMFSEFTVITFHCNFHISFFFLSILFTCNKSLVLLVASSSIYYLDQIWLWLYKLGSWWQQCGEINFSCASVAMTAVLSKVPEEILHSKSIQGGFLEPLLGINKRDLGYVPPRLTISFVPTLSLLRFAFGSNN